MPLPTDLDRIFDEAKAIFESMDIVDQGTRTIDNNRLRERMLYLRLFSRIIRDIRTLRDNTPNVTILKTDDYNLVGPGA